MYTQKIGSCARRGFYCLINQQSRLCELGTNQACVYQRWDLVGGTESRRNVCKISQLFECHILSVNELVRDRYASTMNCFHLVEVALLGRFGKSLHAASIVMLPCTHEDMHAHTCKHTDKCAS